MRLRIAPLLVAALLVIAGCTGTPTQEPTDQTSSTTTGADQQSTVAFEELAPEARELFEAALDSGSERRTGIDGDSFRPFVVNDYVRYEGRQYRVRGQRRQVPRTVLVNVTEVEGSVNESRHSVAVVSYEELDEEARATFRSVLLGNESSVSYAPDEFPFPGEPIGDPTGYVRYDGTYYRLEIARGHVYEYHLSVSNASSSGT